MRNLLKAGIFLIISLMSGKIFSQAISVNNPQLNFGNVFENHPDSLPLTLSNTLSRTVTITGFHFYDTYGSPAFSTSFSWFTIPAGGSTIVYIKFAPRHNIYHNSEVVIENDGLQGYISVDLTGQGKYSNHYYDLTENLSEENLKTSINLITGNGYVSLGYNVARDSMFMSFDNKKVNGMGASQNTLECIYTGREAVGYTDRTDCQNNFAFNTEHTFPQSLFTSMEPMKSDLHHLYPTDNVANNQRGDNPFGVVANPTWTVGGSKAISNLFEPRDEQKGRAARSLLYFVLRYQNYNNFINSQEAILRTWHTAFPPTTNEKIRNNAIFSLQHNRNPFVDYPVFIERIQSFASTSSAPIISSLNIPEDTIVYGTIQTGVPVTFNFVIVNNGNQSINLSNFNLTHSSELTFVAGGSNNTLSPGESQAVKISCTTLSSDSIRAFLSFNTTATGLFNVSVPIFVNDLLVNNVDNIFSNVSVTPNPAHDQLHIKFTKNFSYSDWALFDIRGKKISSGKVSGIDTIIGLEGVNAGVYILKLNSASGNWNTKVLIY